jgi:hypothetical protein
MARNGSGTYTNPYPTFVANTVISSTEVNTNNAQMAAALTASIANDGQTPILANLPMSGFKHTGATATSGTNSGEYMVRDYYLLQQYLDNVVINADGAINIVGTTSTADDAYGGPEAWYTLNQTAATSWAQGLNMEATTPFYQRGTQSQVAAQRFGRAQIIESANCRHMRGQAIALSARVQLSTTATLRYAVLEWTGTADSVTSDVVNDWTSSTYTAGNFFVSTTTNVLAVGSIALTAATPATITVLPATVGASMNNLIVFFWTEATAAQNVTLDIAKASLKLGSVATPYYPRPIADEALKCARLYQQSYSDAVAPGTVTSAGQFAITDPVSQGTWWVPCRATMRIAPSVAIYSPATGASGKYRDNTSGADFDADTSNIGQNSFSPYAAVAHGAADESISLHWTASARL